MKYTLPALILMILLTGCSDDGNKGDPTLRSGQLFFSGIDGLTYQTATLSGNVNEDGTFNYRAGETVSFWLGDIMLAEMVAPDLRPVTLLTDSQPTPWRKRKFLDIRYKIT
jgi:para-nitrobenzyl esterase